MSTQRSPNVLSVGDTVWCALFSWEQRSGVSPLLVRVRGFTGPYVDIEAVARSDDPMVERRWRVPFSYLRRSVGGGSDHL